LSFQCGVGLEKVDNEFIEFFVTEPIIVAHPMSGVGKIEVKLGKT